MPANPAPTGEDVSYLDQFEVRNQYVGPQLGLSAGGEYLRWFWQASGKLGLGWVHAQGTASGGTRIATARLPGGVLASSEGSGDSDTLAVVPELSLAAGYQLTAWCRARVGYDFLLVSRIARAGSQIAPVDSSRVPLLPTFVPSAAPGISGNPRFDSFWVQGFSAGVEIRY